MVACWGGSFFAGFYGMMQHGGSLTTSNNHIPAYSGTVSATLSSKSPSVVPAAIAIPRAKREETIAGKALSMLGPQDRGVVELLTRQPEHQQGFWSKVLDGSSGNQGKRLAVLADAVKAVDTALHSAGADVWDDASCEDFYEVECPDWAARDPSECVVRGSMLSSCKRTCGYCGPLMLLGRELDRGRAAATTPEPPLPSVPAGQLPRASSRTWGAGSKPSKEGAPGYVPGSGGATGGLLSLNVNVKEEATVKDPRQTAPDDKGSPKNGRGSEGKVGEERGGKKSKGGGLVEAFLKEKAGGRVEIDPVTAGSVPRISPPPTLLPCINITSANQPQPSPSPRIPSCPVL